MVENYDGIIIINTMWGFKEYKEWGSIKQQSWLGGYSMADKKLKYLPLEGQWNTGIEQEISSVEYLKIL